ncbi:MAG TPA: hypothetical protein VFE14_03880 [Micromonosporaceae bacterium]|jgi:hypothetical protein|nr:hypothetical protein [Micromonosporaceae bacterium]
MPGILTRDEAAELGGLIAAGTAGGQLRACATDVLIRAARYADALIRHPLGFLCLPLHRGTGLGLCLHVWLPGLGDAELTTSPVHAHTWDLTSHVVCGQVNNELIGIEEGGTHRICAIISEGGVDKISPTSRLVAYRVVGTQRVGPGQTYTLPAGRFHTTRTPAAAATLVLAETRLPPPEYALGDPGTRSHRVVRRPGTREEFRLAAQVLGVRYETSGVTVQRTGT